MEKICLLDGAMGTALWERSGDQSPVWQFNLTAPDLVEEMHRAYIGAGAEIILTNTFAANRLMVEQSAFSLEKVMREGTAIAKSAAAGKARVGLDIGPLNVLMEPYGDLEEDEVGEIYAGQIGCGMLEKPDCIWLETFFDLNMLEVAVRTAGKYGVPVYASMAYEAVGKTMMGNAVEDMVETLRQYELAGIGLNCSLTPAAALPVIRRFRECTDLPLIFKPNAGKPIVDAQGAVHSEAGIEQFVREFRPALPLIDYAGGCCGTDPAYIAALREAITKK